MENKCKYTQDETTVKHKDKSTYPKGPNVAILINIYFTSVLVKSVYST